MIGSWSDCCLWGIFIVHLGRGITSKKDGNPETTKKKKYQCGRLVLTRVWQQYI